MISPFLVLTAVTGGALVGYFSKFMWHRQEVVTREDPAKFHTFNMRTTEPVYTSGRGEPWHCESKVLDPENPSPYRLAGTLVQMPPVNGAVVLKLYERILGRDYLYQAYNPANNMRVHFTADQACMNSDACSSTHQQQHRYDTSKPYTYNLTDGDIVTLPYIGGQFKVCFDTSNFFG